ncbi:unnamed protein product [Ixodes pacificus]
MAQSLPAKFIGEMLLTKFFQAQKSSLKPSALQNTCVLHLPASTTKFRGFFFFFCSQSSCVEHCVGKSINVNHRMMAIYMEVQPEMMKHALEAQQQQQQQQEQQQQKQQPVEAQS